MSTFDNFQTLSVNQQPGSGTDYPFVDPSFDVKYLLGDLWLGYEVTGQDYTLPFKIAWLYGFGTVSNSNPVPGHTAAHAQDVVITDAAGVVVFDSTQAVTFQSSVWGLHLSTLCWTGPQGVLRLTRHINPPDWLASPTYYTYMVPASGEIDSRSYEKLPRRVKSLIVSGQSYSGDIELNAGYNIKLTPSAATATQTGGRLQSQIVVRASPGDGLGSPACADVGDNPLLRVNGVSPDAGGNLKLDALECYRLQREVTITTTPKREAVSLFTPGAVQNNAVNRLVSEGWLTVPAERAVAQATLQVNNDCGPCCECSDFVDTYKALYKLDAVYRDMGRNAEAARNQHKTNIARWNAELQCRLAAATRLLLMPEPSGIVYTAGAYCNMTNGCASGIALRITIETMNNNVLTDQSGLAMLRCRENYRSGTDTKYQEVQYVPAGAWPIYDTFFDVANPGTTSRFRTRLNVILNLNHLDAIRVTFSLHIAKLLYLSSVPDSKRTTLPLVTPPSSIQTMWLSNPPPYPTRAFVQQTVPYTATSGCGSCP